MSYATKADLAKAGIVPVTTERDPMSYSHCERHDVDSTNGCRACEREEALEETSWHWERVCERWVAIDSCASTFVFVAHDFLKVTGGWCVPVEVVRAVLEHSGDPGP